MGHPTRFASMRQNGSWMEPNATPCALQDQLPPVNALSSLTTYEQPQSLLVANQSTAISSTRPMLPKLKRDADGGRTLIVQNESPGKDEEANWLPAPKGPFSAILRLYWPEAVEGNWNAPPLKRAG
jgi:hypothetical protein